jgi:heterodisulfide reductase subunit A
MERKIGVYVCECGPNIAEKINIDQVINAISSSNDVAVVERYKLLCSADGKKFLEEQIKKHGLTHLVIAACSPKEHEKTFMEVCANSGINPYLLQLTNIREQCAWITEDKDEATKKAIRMIKAAIGRVQYHSSLDKKEIESNPDVLIIGGGIAGIEASLRLVSHDRNVYLVEKTSSLGGSVTNFEKTFLGMNPISNIIDKKIQEVKDNKNVHIFTDAEVKETIGLTSLEFERINKEGKIILKNGKPPKSVAIIHCVGRDERGYCSEICCLYSLKFVRYLKEKIPQIKVTNFYSDLCIPGKTNQKFYKQTKGKDVDFIRFSDIEISKNKDQINLSYMDEKNCKKSLQTDMVILSPAIEPGIDAPKIAEITGISQDEKGFFAEAHEKLAPISTSTEGIYIVGCAQGPKNISDTLVQSEAAAGKILSSLIPGRKIEAEVKTSEISESFCIGCKTCLSVCSYGAITFDETKKVSVVNEVICRGCGNCVAACPSGAAHIKHFEFNQIYQEVKEAVK